METNHIVYKYEGTTDIPPGEYNAVYRYENGSVIISLDDPIIGIDALTGDEIRESDVREAVDG